MASDTNTTYEYKVLRGVAFDMVETRPFTGGGAADGRLSLPVVAPFDWRQTVAALEGWSAAPDRGVATRSTPGWTLGVRLPDSDAAVAVTVRPNAENRLDVEVHADSPSPTVSAGIASELRHRLALDLETAPLHEAARSDDPFLPVARTLLGFHPPLSASAFAAACWTVIRQRTPPAFATASMERLVEALGTELFAPAGERLLVFPTPAQLSDPHARPALLAATNNLRKVERLHGLASAFTSVDEGWLRSAPYDEVFGWLRKLPGVGPWSAEQVLWRGLGRYERVPWLDTGALSAVGDVYLGGLTPARGTAREIAERYGWLQGLWLRYLKAYPRVRRIS